MQIFSLDPMDFDEPIRVMIEFIAHHPIVLPLTKIAEPPIPLCFLHISFEHINIVDDVLETKITGDRIVHVYKSTLLKVIGVKENPPKFKVQEPTTEEFQ